MLQVLKFIAATILVLHVSGIVAFAPAVAQAPSAGPVNAPIVSANPGGMQRHVPGRWAMLSVSGRNPTDSDVEETVTVIVGDETNLQYARRLWIPAGAKRQGLLPIQIPDDIDYGQHQIDITTIQLRGGEGGTTEQFGANLVGMPSTSRSLLLSEEETRAAVIFDKPSADDDVALERIEDIAATINVGRDASIESDRDLGLFYVNDHFLPSSPVGLDEVDQIIIASDRILSDTLSLSRLRSWVQAGGQLWIMVDRVSPEVARALLGDIHCYSVVDSVELNEFSLSSVGVGAASQNRRVEQWASEIPVDFVRVFAESDDIVCAIDGWPAAFFKEVGSGQVLFTTLGARGWMDENRPLLTYGSIAQRFFNRRAQSSEPTTELIAFVDDEIGYEIPGRAAVASILGLHLLVVIAAGVWFFRQKNLHYLAVVIPLASLIAAATFVSLGKKQTDAVPSMVATSQIVQNLPNSSKVKLHSVAAVYSQVARPLEIVSSSDSTSMLRDGLEDGEVKRILWDDSGESRWQFVTQPPGVVRHVETNSTIELPEPWVVRGSFTSQGFAGQVFGLNASRCEDAVIIASPAPSLGVDLKANAIGFSSDRNDVLAADQFINASIVSDVQRDRQQLVRDMLASETPPFGTDPIMLVWTDPVDSGVNFDDDFARRGSALVSLPVKLEPPPSGSDFQVPATFVRIEPHAGTRGTTAIFNGKTGQWIDMNKPSEAELRCVVPSMLLPCKLSRAHLTIKLNAPSRTLEVKGLVDGKFVTLHEKPDPTGVLRIDIDDPQALQLDNRGGLVLALAISPSVEELLAAEAKQDDPTANEAADANPSRSTWKIDYVHVDFEGTTL